MKKKIKDVIQPIDGLFENMPNDIWGDLFQSSELDIEFFTKYGGLFINPLCEYYVNSDGELNVADLAKLIYRKNKRSWEMTYKVLFTEYDAFLTSYSTEERTRMVKDINTSTTDMTKTNTGKQTSAIDANITHSKSGSINQNISNTDTYNRTDSNTINKTQGVVESGKDINKTEISSNETNGMKGTDTVTTNNGLKVTNLESGSDSNKTTYNTTESGNDVLTKSGSENRSGSDVLTKSGSENRSGSDNRTINLSENASGSQGTSHSEQLAGFGGGGVSNVKVTTDDTSNSSSKSNGGTDNLAKTDNLSFVNRTDNVSKTDNLSFTNRTDKTQSSTSKTGNDTVANTYGKKVETTNSGSDVQTTLHGTTNTIDRNGEDLVTTTFGKKVDVTDDGTDTLKQTGTISSGGSNNTTYNNYVENNRDVTSNTRTDALNEKNEGVVADDRTIEETDLIEIKANSPLRTNQALILEEIAVRQNNFTTIVMESIKELITLQVWDGDIYG